MTVPTVDAQPATALVRAGSRRRHRLGRGERVGVRADDRARPDPRQGRFRCHRGAAGRGDRRPGARDGAAGRRRPARGRRQPETPRRPGPGAARPHGLVAAGGGGRGRAAHRAGRRGCCTSASPAPMAWLAVSLAPVTLVFARAGAAAGRGAVRRARCAARGRDGDPGRRRPDRLGVRSGRGLRRHRGRCGGRAADRVGDGAQGSDRSRRPRRHAGRRTRHQARTFYTELWPAVAGMGALLALTNVDVMLAGTSCPGTTRASTRPARWPARSRSGSRRRSPSWSSRGCPTRSSATPCSPAPPP